jgi:hypothetical protein
MYKYQDQHCQRQQPPRFHFAVAGEGDDAVIMAYGSAVAVGVLSVDDGVPQKAWTCSVCTFHNSETLGRFCSMCGSPRIGGEISGNAALKTDQTIFCPQQGKLESHRIEGLPESPHQKAVSSTREYSPQQSRGESLLEDRDTVTELLPSSSHQRRYHYPHQNFRGPRRLASIEPPRVGGGLQRLRSLEPPETWGHTTSRSPIESPTHQFGQDQENSLNFEESFSFLSLMDGPPLVEPSYTQPSSGTSSKAPSAHITERQRPSTLSEKEFQMSFANWSMSDNGAWTCIACTFVNVNPLHLTCEICGQNRPSSKDRMMEQSQRVMQDMLETSFRTGQQDFLRRQSRKIEVLEDRVVTTERLQEIMNYQNEILGDYNEQRGYLEYKTDGDNTNEQCRVEMSVSEKAQLTNEWIDRLEQVRGQERAEQDQMEVTLRSRRKELGMDRYASSEGPVPGDCSITSAQNSESAQCTVRAQERLLSQWKRDWESRETQLQEIRLRQRTIFERLHCDTFSIPEAKSAR